jgi:hypothetical protein
MGMKKPIPVWGGGKEGGLWLLGSKISSHLSLQPPHTPDKLPLHADVADKEGIPLQMVGQKLFLKWFEWNLLPQATH